MTSHPLNRRHFLYSSAIVAGAAALSACSSDEPEQQGRSDDASDAADDQKGSHADPVPVPTDLVEAPALAERVQAGELPPLEERLPTNPYVVPHKWITPGKYGGTLLVLVSGTEAGSNRNYMYGHSFVRWINDGIDIVPGLVESWETNDDASEWILHFRPGLKWSDGEPWTTQDIVFWWEDMVLNDEHPEAIPDDARSGTGEVMQLEAPDDVTIVLRFDAPAPVMLERMADWVKRGLGTTWMEPRHYLEQFHPTYAEGVASNWATADGEFEQKRNWMQNPECPTMTGWTLESYNEGQSLVWQRNPYYWCVDQAGAQLPYIDTLTMVAVSDPELGKLNVQNGEVDYAHGPYVGIGLVDVSDLREVQSRSGMDVLLWDSGTGTGSVFLFNWDYEEPQMRELIRNSTFRRALSHAFNREEARKAIYFDTGELTTGTMGPKAGEYRTFDEGTAVYRDWRDSYVEYDPELAEQLLDEIDVIDRDGDGWRELPGGEPLVIRIEVPGEPSLEHQQKNNLLERDWAAVGLRVQQNPVAATAWESEWTSGKVMSHAAREFSGNPSLMSFPGALVPIELTWWAPLHAQYHELRGTPQADAQDDLDPYDRTPPRVAPEEGGPIDRLYKLYDEAKLEPDQLARHQLVWELTKIHIDEGPFFIGSVANSPQVMMVSEELRNVPRRENLWQGGWVNAWVYPTPAVYDPEVYYWDSPDEHT